MAKEMELKMMLAIVKEGREIEKKSETKKNKSKDSKPMLIKEKSE